MIILDETDAASLHTLVHVPEPDANPNSNPKIPATLSPLTFTSFALSVLPFTFALLNVSLTRLHIPTFIVFVFGVPFNVGTILTLSRLSARSSSMTFNQTWRVNSVAYVTLLLSLWICTGIMNGLTLVYQWQIVEKLCSPLYQNIPTCSSKARLMFMVSTIFAAVEVVILGIMIATLSRWDPLSSQPSSNPRATTFGLNLWKVPLIFASFVFTAPPLANAILNANIPFFTMYTIPTIIAYVLTTPFHIGIIIMWRISSRTPSVPFEVITTKRCISVVFFLLLAWLLSTIMGARLAVHPQLLEKVCRGPRGSNPRCEAQTQVYFTASTVSSAFEVVVLGAIFAIAMIRILRKPKAETTTSPPTRQIQTFKGPMTVMSDRVGV